MDAVIKAKARIRAYPRLLADCRNESKIYATCVLSKQDDVQQNACLKEFRNLRNCLLHSAVKLKTRV